MNPIPFADDPVRGKPISLATGDVEGLNTGQWLSTSLVDYVLQTSLAAIEISPPSFASVGDVQLAERNTDAGPGMEFGPTEEPGQEQDPILDYEDNYFQENFSSKGVVCGTVDDVVVAINEYQESSGNVLSTVRTRGNARTFVCISHANCPFSVKFGPMPKQEGIFYKGSGLRRRWSKVFRPPDH